MRISKKDKLQVINGQISFISDLEAYEILSKPKKLSNQELYESRYIKGILVDKRI